LTYTAHNFQPAKF